VAGCLLRRKTNGSFGERGDAASCPRDQQLRAERGVLIVRDTKGGLPTDGGTAEQAQHGVEADVRPTMSSPAPERRGGQTAGTCGAQSLFNDQRKTAVRTFVSGDFPLSGGMRYSG
jgi:hypothetical protein